MEYVIYTYGGGAILVSVFNAIAMLFQSDNTYLTPVGTMALTLGGIYAGIKATFKGDIGLIGKSWMIPSMITFLVLFSPKSTVWIKDEVALTAPVKIDHIPIGISFFTSIASTISHHLSKQVEETMLPANMGGATTTGILYGAKAVAKLRDIQIDDPILLRNAKEYMRQCYMKPYVMGDFGGHKANAIRSTNLLEYLDQHPVKCFGIKPTNRDGSIGEFMTCTEAGKMIKRGIEAESRSPSLMRQFAASIGIASADEALMNRRIKAMTTDTFKYLQQGQEDVTEWMKQTMTLNANRESYDDWREKVGHPRVYPDLVRMQATRGLFQQSMGSIFGGEMSEALLPAAAQPVMLALVIMMFVIILPFALLPGGWLYIVTGVKLMIWVCSWPVFYTIIHAIAMIQLKDSIGNWGEDGLSLVGQAGFTQLIMMRYATVQSLITATPLISFAVIFGSPYALSSIAGSIAGVSSSAAIGSNMADGNLSMGQVSYNNITKGQHNLAPTLSMGNIVDDGVIRQTTSHDGQSTVLTEHGDQLVNNHTMADSAVATSNESFGNAKSSLAALTTRQSENAIIGKIQGVDFATGIANGTITSDGISDTSLATLKSAYSSGGGTRTADTIGDGQSTGTSSHLELKLPPIPGVGAGTGTSASNTHDIRKDMSVEERQNFDTAMEQANSVAKTGNFTTTNSEDRKLGESYGATLLEQEQITKDIAKTKQDIDTYSNQVSYAESNAGAINRNLNDPFLREVMNRNPELASKEQALRWTKTHQAEADAIGRDVTHASNLFESADYKAYVERMTQNTPSAQNTVIATPDSLESKYRENATRVEEQAVVKDTTGELKQLKEVVANAASNSNLRHNEDVKEMLQSNLSAEQQKSMTKIEEGKKNNKDIKAEIKQAKADTSKSTIYRATEQVGYNAGLSARAIGEKNIIMPGYKDKDKK